jgi:hypothetical protein
MNGGECFQQLSDCFSRTLLKEVTIISYVTSWFHKKVKLSLYTPWRQMGGEEV